MRDITCISVDMTTHCDRRCADCCADIGQRPAIHHDWSYFERLAPFTQGIDRVNLTGGEPTIHPQFADFVPRFRKLFGCNRLTLSTDGCKVEQHREVITQHIDEVHASRYDSWNNPKIDALLNWHPNVLIFDGEFTPRAHRGSGKPCARGFSEAVAHADGRLFPCCVGPGIPGAASTEPCEGWQQKIQDVPLPCSDCWFSE